MQVAAPSQGGDFIDEPVAQHRPETRRDARMQPAALARLECDQRRSRRVRMRPVGRRVSMPGGERPAADPVHFERALDPLRVERREPRGGRWIDARELGVKRRPAVLRGLRIECRADGGVGRRHRIEAVEQRLEVEHRAADEKRQRAARADLGNEPARVLDEERRRPGFGRIDDVDQVVRNERALGRARLRGADVHAAIDQRRIDADDLDRQPRREARRDGERRRGLARCGRAGDAEHGERVGRCERLQAGGFVLGGRS
jgi:hypothetical protein